MTWTTETNKRSINRLQFYPSVNFWSIVCFGGFNLAHSQQTH